MKKLIQWLAKVFNANITNYVYKEIIVYRATNEYIDGDMIIDGDLKITGRLIVRGDVICYKLEN